MFAGLLFESFKISENWKTVIYTFIIAYFSSLVIFLPGKNEPYYVLENHLELWPYSFLVIFSVGFAAFNAEKVTIKLTEGMTLLLSISLIYWSIDYGFTKYHNWFAIALIIVGFVFTVFAFLNAFTRIQLTRTSRLTLSIWSTIILFSFAVDNIIRVFSNEEIEATKHLSDGLYIAIQYFLLGVSAIYIMQNYILLSNFLPNRGGNYRRDLIEIKKEHIDRFSDEQAYIGHSLLCLLYSVIVYWLNYTYQILPRHTMIWLVFLTFPLILNLPQLIRRKKHYH